MVHTCAQALIYIMPLGGICEIWRERWIGVECLHTLHNVMEVNLKCLAADLNIVALKDRSTGNMLIDDLVEFGHVLEGKS